MRYAEGSLAYFIPVVLLLYTCYLTELAEMRERFVLVLACHKAPMISEDRAQSVQ